MRDIRPLGPYKDIVEAMSPSGSGVVKLGIRVETFRRHVAWGMKTPMAQYYGIVQEGLLGVEHIFRGLNRDLSFGDDMNADENVLVYVWRPEYDYEWIGAPYGGIPEEKNPPDGKVFVVLAREEETNDYGVVGSIERWNWVREDPERSLLPVRAKQRYGKAMWSKTV